MDELPAVAEASVLRKIDCVMVQVDDLEIASDFYARAFGLRRLWHDESSVGMGMPETDAEIVLHTMSLPRDCGVHYLVDDVLTAVSIYSARGGVVREPPFDVAVGRCAVLEDPFGNALCILDLSKGSRWARQESAPSTEPMGCGSTIPLLG